MSVEQPESDADYSAPRRAVFLSYAREDAAAARRIAEALRAAGMEAWFDENELRGGDAWDAKIRGQIKACALFVPVISATTQARDEAYFRLEWKLADDRSHLMAPGRAFIVPVVIDGTAEGGASVPDSFSRAQWTRLPGALPTPQFVEQIRRLLGASRRTGGTESRQAQSPGPSAPARRHAGIPGWVWGALAAVIVAGGAGLAWWRQSEPEVPPKAGTDGARAATPMQSVAVLAFANLSDDKANEYFSDGISEELLNVLAKVPGLKVSARTSAFHFKGRNVPVSEIARQLGVEYVVEGSVQRAGERVKITAQLIKAADGFHLWSEAYTRDMKDIFALQDELAGKIASSLTDKLGINLPATTKTTPEAYTLYLQARAALAKRGVANLQEGVRLFAAVIAADPDYLPARSGLAITLALIPSWSRSIALGANQESLERAKREARFVIERQPGNAEAWSALGLILGLYDWRWQEAGEAIVRSLALAPNDAEIVNFAGDYYRYVLDEEKVVEMEKRAVELNPLHAVNHTDLNFCYIALRQYERAIEPALRAVAMRPDQVDNYEGLVRAYGALGRFKEMREILASVRRVAAPDSSVLANMEILADISEGKTADAMHRLEKFLPYVEKEGYSPAEYGFHHLRMGHAEKALPWLKLGAEGHDASLVDACTVDLDLVAANPVTRVVLDEPGLKELLEIRARNARVAKAQK